MEHIPDCINQNLKSIYFCDKCNRKFKKNRQTLSRHLNSQIHIRNVDGELSSTHFEDLQQNDVIMDDMDTTPPFSHENLNPLGNETFDSLEYNYYELWKRQGGDYDSEEERNECEDNNTDDDSVADNPLFIFAEEVEEDEEDYESDEPESVMPIERSEFYPFPNKIAAVTSILMNRPRHPLSLTNMKDIWWWAQQLGLKLPPLSRVRKEIDQSLNVVCLISFFCTFEIFLIGFGFIFQCRF